MHPAMRSISDSRIARTASACTTRSRVVAPPLPLPLPLLTAAREEPPEETPRAPLTEAALALTLGGTRAAAAAALEEEGDEVSMTSDFRLRSAADADPEDDEDARDGAATGPMDGEDESFLRGRGSVCHSI